MVDHIVMKIIKGMDTFERLALLTAVVGVIGGGVALYTLAQHAG